MHRVKSFSVFPWVVGMTGVEVSDLKYGMVGLSGVGLSSNSNMNGNGNPNRKGGKEGLGGNGNGLGGGLKEPSTVESKVLKGTNLVDSTLERIALFYASRRGNGPQEVEWEDYEPY